MHSRLHSRFTLIYSFTTGAIITLVIFFVFLFIKYQTELNAKKVLSDILSQIEYKLQTEQQIGQSWLATASSDNDMYIYIEDNTIPLQIMNFVISPDFRTEKASLVEKIKQLALKDGIDTSYYPISFTKDTSRIHFFRGDKFEPYFGCISLFTASGGWQSIILIQSLSRQRNLLIRYGLLLFIINCAVVIFLYYFSRYFVGKTLEPVIENEQKQKEFIASASHELKSPLSVIRATLSSLVLNEGLTEEVSSGSVSANDIVQDNFENDFATIGEIPEVHRLTIGSNRERRIEYYRDIDEETLRMSMLIDELLLLTTSQAQKRTLNKDTFDAEAFFIDLYEAYSLVAMKKNLTLQLDLPEETLRPVCADKLRLRQAVTILLDNAISYTPSGKSIILQVSQKKLLLIIRIIDQGIGIPEENKPFIFDTFYRADPSRLEKNHFGLGLSIAKELITLHNGRITASDTPGGGTTFTVEIPAE